MTTPPEALREMGAEFHHAAAKCDDALHALESARQDRITFLREAIKRNEERLSDIKEESRRLPEQIAKWEAERARLESQTGLDLLRAVVTERGEKTGEPSPNRFDCEECGTGVSADEDGCCATCGRTCWQWVNGECVLAGGAEPEEMPADRAEVEKMADEAERKPEPVCSVCQDTHRMELRGDAVPCTHCLTPCDACRGGRGGFCEQTPCACRCHAKQEQPPALLDLRGLKVGTVCEATGVILTYFRKEIHAGERFVVVEPDDKLGDKHPTNIVMGGAGFSIPALVPARVVEEPK